MTTFLKWVGGKTQIIDTLISNFPNRINTYYELFVGGGSVFIALLHKIEANEISVKHLVICDINPNLINCYNQIKNNVAELITELEKLQLAYTAQKLLKNDIQKAETPTTKEQLYYAYRNKYNEYTQFDAHKAALFIFLNKTGFRGLYRESKGKFNVPFGNYNKPAIFSSENLNELHRLFNAYDIQFNVMNYNNLLQTHKLYKTDFIYMDPPYYPIDAKSFQEYCGDFSQEHEKLAKLIHTINAKKVKVLMSNSWVPWIQNSFKLPYHVSKILCKRSINSKKPNSTEYESLVANYKLSLENLSISADSTISK